MINSEKNIFLNEIEIKPNTYASYVMVFSFIGIIFCWLLTEVGIFRVGLSEMRIGSVLSIIALAIPTIPLLFVKSTRADPRMKYVIIFASLFYTLVTTSLLHFHTTILLLYPMFIAMMYRSVLIGRIAFWSSMGCTVFSPIIGYLLGSWDVPLLQELILIATGGTAEIVDPTYTVSWIGIGKILLYLVIPRLIIVGSCAILMFKVIEVGRDHVNNQILLNKISHRDILTGLYNQNYYKELLSDRSLSGPVGVVFFDVNDLKAANDMKGHEYGDLLLKRSAQSLIDVCDDDHTHGFRLGGDEFLLIIEGADESAVLKKLNEWNAALARINEENRKTNNGLLCSVANGFTTGDFSDLDSLVRHADRIMYQNKAAIKAR